MHKIRVDLDEQKLILKDLETQEKILIYHLEKSISEKKRVRANQLRAEEARKRLQQTKLYYQLEKQRLQNMKMEQTCMRSLIKLHKNQEKQMILSQQNQQKKLQKQCSEMSEEMTLTQKVQERKNNKLQKILREQINDHKTVMQQMKNKLELMKTKVDQKNIQFQKCRQVIEQTKKQISVEESKLNKPKSPQAYKQSAKEMFISFLDNLKTYKLQQSIEKQPNCRYFMVMGKISAGKSSLLASIFNVNLSVGVGQTTLEAKQIGKSKSRKGPVRIFDSPGVNEEFAFTNPDTMGLIKTMDKIFICYNTSIKQIVEFFQVVFILKSLNEIVLIRTKCDEFERPNQQRTLKQQIEKDHKQFVKYFKRMAEKMKIKMDNTIESYLQSFRIYRHSADRGDAYFDNLKVKKLIHGNQN